MDRNQYEQAVQSWMTKLRGQVVTNTAEMERLSRILEEETQELTNLEQIYPHLIHSDWEITMQAAQERVQTPAPTQTATALADPAKAPETDPADGPAGHQSPESHQSPGPEAPDVKPQASSLTGTPAPRQATPQSGRGRAEQGKAAQAPQEARDPPSPAPAPQEARNPPSPAPAEGTRPERARPERVRAKQTQAEQIQARLNRARETVAAGHLPLQGEQKPREEEPPGPHRGRVGKSGSRFRRAATAKKVAPRKDSRR